MAGFWIEAAIIAVFLAYTGYVNRPVSHYRMRMHVDAPAEIVWQAHQLRPEHPELWFPGMSAITWEDEARTTYRMQYTHGKVEALCRDIEIVAPVLSISEGAYLRTRDNSVLDTFRSEARFKPAGDGVTVTTEMTFARQARWAGLNLRLTYPFLGLFIRGRIEKNVQQLLAAQGNSAQTGAVTLDGWYHGWIKRLGGWPVVLSVAAIAWFIIDLGFWPGLVLIATIIVHEGGHLWSMRRHGVPAKATLVPFFGGMAYGAKPMPSDVSDAEMTLMGPAFGFGLGILLYMIALGADAQDFWLAAAGMALLVNGFNLLPVLPLDGGQVMPLLLRRFGQNVVTGVSLAMVLGGVALAWWASSILLLVLVVALGTMIAFSQPKGTSRPAMSVYASVAVLVAYLGLVAAHIFVLMALGDRLEIDEWFSSLANGPFAG